MGAMQILSSFGLKTGDKLLYSLQHFCPEIVYFAKIVVFPTTFSGSSDLLQQYCCTLYNNSPSNTLNPAKLLYKMQYFPLAPFKNRPPGSNLPKRTVKESNV